MVNNYSVSARTKWLVGIILSLGETSDYSGIRGDYLRAGCYFPVANGDFSVPSDEDPLTSVNYFVTSGDYPVTARFKRW